MLANEKIIPLSEPIVFISKINMKAVYVYNLYV